VSALRLERVSVTLGGARIVDSLSFELARGEWAALIGPNGAGKTTTLRAALGLVPYDGRVELLGDDARTLHRREVARRVALVPQSPVLPPDATVREYVLLGRTPHLSYLASEGAQDHAAVERALERLDLVPFAERRLASLSGGEQQRAIFARALAQDAAVLLLDEPTAALDIGRQQQVLELVDELRLDRSIAVLSAMHDLTLAGQYASRLLLLSGGSVVARGAPDEVLRHELISEHYGAEVEIVGEPGSALVVVPVRRYSTRRSDGS
jgi:cobalamin transport system ATP-binding protein